MAEQSYKTILEVETGTSVKTIGALKESIKALNKEIDNTELNDAELAKKEKELATQKETLNNLTRNGAKDYAEARKQAEGLDESYNGLRARMASLTKEWHAVDRTLEPEKWEKLRVQIGSTRETLKNMDASVGNFQRNVGDYKNQMVAAFQATAGAAGGMIAPIGGVTAGLKALSATPVIAILGLLAQVINQVIKGFQSSEENVFALKKAFSAFQPIADAVTNTMQFLAKGIVKVVEGVGKLARKLKLVNEEAVAEREDIASREEALTKRQREATMQQAVDENRIAKLREKATDKLKYSHAERIGFLKEAIALEDAVAKRNVEIAKEQYAIQQIKAEWTGNDKATNDELAESYANVQRAETDYFNKKKELNAQMAEATNQMKAETEASRKQAEEQEKRRAEEEEMKAKRAKNANLAVMLQENDKNRIVLDSKIVLNEESKKLDDERLKQADEFFEKEKQKEEEQAEFKKQMAMTSVATLSSMFGAMASIYEADERSRGKNAGKIKALRIAEATMSTIQGAIDAYNSAQNLPAPANFIVGGANAGIVTATGIANIKKIKATKIPNGGGGTATSLGAIGGAIASPVGGTPSLPPAYRTLTGAKTEETLQNFGNPQKVYILSSDLEANGRKVAIRTAESTF